MIFIRVANGWVNNAFSDKEFSSVVSTTKTALEVFNDPYIQKSTSTSDFNIKELRSSKLTIYLSSNMSAS
jgi:type IV secretory pathway TraG/TraD family ATPase VirD4